MNTRAILLMILGWTYMKKFSNKIHFGSADSTIWEVYFERNQNQYSFLGKRITQRIKKKGYFSMRLNCLNKFRRNKIFSKIKSLIVFALRKCSWL